MYHEEKIVNGILCHRGMPDAKWIQYTPKQLTEMLEATREDLFKEQIALDEAMLKS